MDDSTLPDEELVQRALDGDNASMELILHRHERAVVAYTRKYFVDPTIAEEVAQDTFLKAARKLATFERKGSLEGWLLRICERCCIDRWRHEQRQPTTVDLDGAGDAALEDRGDVKPALSLVSARRHWDQQQEAALGQRLDEEIKALPVEERFPVSLVCIDGFTQQAAAEILGIPPATLRDRLIRGRLRLREKLNDYRPGRTEHG
jgi:RNA polymerase sigma factor (sigma-70 family)